ncbi:hypothetical protein V1260_00135 [Brachybacterium sp. J144]|uniref:hypothetical protein n=1 Tax=Brachybacterium sp. J144 TaxID=3116487 RepID=UPI002E76DE74|nr:hypothetical protein [Brachybacterium sp. J144]MEE1649194.1 hypothetical protein [Brachybacterium sp. J144]
MRQQLLVGALLLISAAYCWGLGWIAWGFVRAGTPLGFGLAAAVVVLLALTVWVTWREGLFGLAAGRLAARYAAELVHGTEGERPLAPAEEAERAPTDEERRAEFEVARTAVQEGAQDDWRAWFRLALAYDGLRDRKQARFATRRAIDASRRG